MRRRRAVANEFSGVVREAIYMGASSQYRVEVNGGQLVVLDTNFSARDRSWQAGEPVRVTIDPENIVLIGR